MNLETTATIIGRTKAVVMIRIPELHPTRILTLPGSWLKGAKGGESHRVEGVRGGGSGGAGLSARPWG